MALFDEYYSREGVVVFPARGGHEVEEAEEDEDDHVSRQWPLALMLS